MHGGIMGRPQIYQNASERRKARVRDQRKYIAKKREEGFVQVGYLLPKHHIDMIEQMSLEQNESVSSVLTLILDEYCSLKKKENVIIDIKKQIKLLKRT